MTQINEEELNAAVIHKSTAAWFELFARIDTKEGDFIDAPPANFLQLRIDEVLEWFRENNLPARLLILKPRQKGCSTFSTADLYCEASRRRINAIIIGGKHEQSENLYKKVKVYSANDTFEWGTSADVNEIRIRWDNGSELTRKTARDAEAGRSGTYQYVIATEAARWARDGVAKDAEVMAGLVKCVGLTPGTTVILETTANGAAGDFYTRWLAALDFEDFKARFAQGELLSGTYIRVFAPWFAFPDSCFALSPAQEQDVESSLTQKERQIRDAYGLSLGQLAWRRWAVREECEGDENKFEEDYPSSWQTAFLKSGRCRFSESGINFLKKTVRHGQAGCIDVIGSDRIVWRNAGDDEDAQFVVWERPMPGRKYLLTADPMTGEQANGKDPDAHAGFIIRAGYYDAENGNCHRPAVVARTKFGAQWDIDVFALAAWKLAQYYGDCLMVPEINNSGLALVEHWKMLGANIYKREVFGEREQKFTKVYGWSTNVRTRELLINNLAEIVRNYDAPGGGIEIYCADAVQQLSEFVRKASGRAEGENHDDDVMALGIGVSCIDGATILRREVLRRQLPPDLARRQAAGGALSTRAGLT